MLTDDLLSFLAAPEPPASSHDPNDILMGDCTSMSPEDYDEAGYVLIGCPQDLGVVRNHGRPGAARGPAEIRRRLYALKPPADRPDIRLLDLGDIATKAHACECPDPAVDLETIHVRLYSIVARVLADGKIAVVLGGGNDISLPDGKAVHSVFPKWSAMNVDAHLDMRASETVHSGTPYRDLIQGGFLDPANFHEIGTQPQANSAKYLADARTMGVNIHTLRTVQETGFKTFLDDLFTATGATPLFAGLDMDAVRASDAPGVSAPSPVGLTAEDILDFADRCGSCGRTKIFEITETNPDLDRDGRTARLAALAVYVFLYGRK